MSYSDQEYNTNSESECQNMEDIDNPFEDSDFQKDLYNYNQEQFIQELKKEKDKSAYELAVECRKEWDESHEVAKLLWKTSKEYLNLSDTNKQNKVKILNFILLQCEGFSEILKRSSLLVLETSKTPLQWIENWKKDEKEGGKAVSVTRTNTKNKNNLEEFKNIILNAENIKSQIIDAGEDDILSTSKEYTDKITGKKGNNVSIGEVTWEISKTNMDDLTYLFNNISLKNNSLKKNCKYDVDDLIGDMQKKLELNLDNTVKRNIHRFINNKINNKEKNINIENIIDIVKDDIISEKSKDTDSKRSIGVTKESGVISTLWPEEMKFKSPYIDPHFKYFGNKTEYWEPPVHMKSGYRVTKLKKELLRSNQNLNKIYIKLESVKVWDSDKYVNVYYFRKFQDFYDFLKSWQETYVRQYYEKGREIKKHMKLLESRDCKKICILLKRRKYLIQKIKDIKKYFIKENEDNDKLVIYSKDSVVDFVINEELPLIENNLYQKIIDTFDRQDLKPRKGNPNLELHKNIECCLKELSFYPDILLNSKSKKKK